VYLNRDAKWIVDALLSAELKATFQLQILGVKKNPQSPMYTQLGVMTKGTVIEVNVSELGMVTAGGKVVFGKYAQITNNPENDGCINAVLCESTCATTSDRPDFYLLSGLNCITVVSHRILCRRMFAVVASPCRPSCMYPSLFYLTQCHLCGSCPIHFFANQRSVCVLGLQTCTSTGPDKQSCITTTLRRSLEEGAR